MKEIVADRFVSAGAAWIDLSTGSVVRLTVRRRYEGSDALVWNDRCATLSRLRHPVLNNLIDFGQADRERVFEAYAVSTPLADGESGGLWLSHAARFLEAHGIPVTPPVAELALRHVERGGPARGRPIGVVLQRRRIDDACIDALVDAVPGGVSTIDVVGEPGSGLKTVRACVARAARLQGYIPLCPHAIASIPWIVHTLRERHVCVLVDGHDSAANQRQASMLLSDLGLATPRRHVVFRFWRGMHDWPGSLRIEPMGVTAMISMVFVDGERGPAQQRLTEAARQSEGNPARFLNALNAYRADTTRRTAFVVHEATPPYVVESVQPVSRPPTATVRRSSSVASAAERAARLASSGRHGVAIRLLNRASRVLEARQEPVLAADCAVALAWILRDRGRGGDALEHFGRARRLSPGSSAALRAAIGIAIIWTDECRFTESEAALRAALSAAELVNDGDVISRARVALARCLVWQKRLDEAELALQAKTDGSPATALRVRALALLTRIRSENKDYRRALDASGEALRLAGHTDARSIAIAERASAMVHCALGDLPATRAHVCRGLRAAAQCHLPLDALRLRGTLLAAALGRDEPGASRLASQVRWALRHRPLSTLLRNSLESSLTAQASRPPELRRPAAPALDELQKFIEQAHGASDDEAAMEAVSGAVCEALRAATVQIVSSGPERRLIARAGRPWSGDISFIERVMAGATAAPDAGGSPARIAEPIRYSNDIVAVLACRWSAGAAVDQERSMAVLRAAALALATSVRGVLDRTRPTEADPVWRDLIGSSPAADTLRVAIARAARAPFPVLIEGESGSGKELVARAIHRLSARRDRRLCAVNCAALSEELLEAELFGHARGAFTGAVGERAGLFEEADGGTLFLDEVGELSPRAQAKLLRVLQDGEVRRVGENLPRKVDPRVIAATNRQLDQETESGRFRADLKFRLDVVRISVPPLRERTTDIPQLVAHFWTEAAQRVGSRASLAPETITTLTRFDWPGNVRQLQNVIASLAVHAPRRGRVSPSLLPAQVAKSTALTETTFDAAREEFERRFVAAALARAGGQRARAARAIGVTRQGFAKMLKRLKLE
jgi:two-component system, NtrC family, response regulator AtoC